MNMNGYQTLAQRTCNITNAPDDKIMNGCMGLNGEAGECIDLLKKVKFQGHELDLMFHIPNGGKRSKAEAARFKELGVMAGVSDVFLPVARNGCHGLWIEMKRLRSGRPSKDQLEWIENMIKQGYAATVCHGWEQAKDAIEKYMEGK